MYLFGLAKPPDLLVKKNTNKVDEPYEGSTEEEDDCNNDSYVVLCIDTLQKSVNCPNDVKCGKAENELYDKRKPINCFNDVFH